MAIGESLMTAEEFLKLPDNGQPTELVRGRIVTMNVPAPRHGQVCAKITRLVGNFAEDKDSGHVVSNDSGIITERDPDTVRGGDVAFYCYEDVPKGPLPRGYLQAMPRLVFEVLSPDDRWSKVLRKVTEYLDAGVRVVCVLDPDEEKAYLYHPDKPEQFLDAGQDLTFPEVLGDFRMPVKRFFE